MNFGSHAALGEAWASGNYNEGQTKAGSTSFSGPSFRSYQTQLAERVSTPSGTFFLIGDGSYSKTTAAKHYPAIWGAVDRASTIMVEASPRGGRLPILEGDALEELIGYYTGLVKDKYDEYFRKRDGSNYPTKGQRMEDCLNVMDQALTSLKTAAENLDGWENVTPQGVERHIQVKTSRQYVNDIKARLVDDLKAFRDKRSRLPAKKVVNARRRQGEGVAIDTFRKDLQSV